MKQRIQFVVEQNLPLLFFALAIAIATAGALGQESASSPLDPGPRGGSLGAGNSIQGRLSHAAACFFHKRPGAVHRSRGRCQRTRRWRPRTHR